MPTRSLFVVNLYQTDTGLVVLAGNDRGVWTGRQTDRDRGFEAVGRSQSIAADQRDLACVTLPVVVRREERAICVAQLQSRIGKGIGNAELLERGAEGANGDASRADFVAGDESPNQHIGAGPDLRAGANIGEPGIGSLIQVIHFCQGDAGSSILTGHDGSVISSREGGDERRFLVVRWGETGPCNLRLLCIFPVVVSHNKRSITAAQLDHRIRERARYAEIGERRPECANPDAFWCRAHDNEATDYDALAGFHSRTARDVQCLRRQSTDPENLPARTSNEVIEGTVRSNMEINGTEDVGP